MKHNLDLIKKFSLFFNQHPQNIELAYIFGSQVTGQGAKKRPDVDIAVLLSPKAWEKNSERFLNKLEENLSSLAPHTEIDLISLNSAGPILRHEIISTGILLHTKSTVLKADRETQWVNEYCDFEPYRRLFWQATRREFGFSNDPGETRG